MSSEIIWAVFAAVIIPVMVFWFTDRAEERGKRSRDDEVDLLKLTLENERARNAALTEHMARILRAREGLPETVQEKRIVPRWSPQEWGTVSLWISEWGQASTRQMAKDEARAAEAAGESAKEFLQRKGVADG